MPFMPEVKVRKFVIAVEDILHEGGPPPPKPLRRGSIVAVIHNPFAGRYVEEITPFMQDLEPLGLDMARKLLAALGGNSKDIEGYGKGAIIGEAGEIEHGAFGMPGITPCARCWDMLPLCLHQEGRRA
jgi:hypothetical protein